MNILTILSLKFIIVVCFITTIISTYITAKVSTDNVINEENKKFTTPIYTTIFITQIIFVIFTLITKKDLYPYTIIEYGILSLSTIGIIISLIYLIQRDNQEMINKNFVFYTLIYEITTLIIILIHLVFNSDYQSFNSESNKLR